MQLGAIKLSLLYSISERYASGIVSSASLIIVSRVMNAREIGVFSVGLSIVNIVDHFRDLGVGNYLLQTQEVLAQEARAVATIIYLSSLLIAVGLVACNDTIAAFYGDRQLQDVLNVLAIGVIFSSVGDIFLILLRREMAFRAISLINVAGNVCGAVLTIVLALLGYGPVSLALGFVATCALSTGLAMTSIRQFSLLLPCASGWGRIISFGFYSAGVASLSQISRSAAEIILGRVVGLEAAGLYSRAGTVINLFNRALMDAVRPVVLPALTERTRHREGINTLYLSAIEHSTALFWPFLAFVAIAAEPVVRIVLGVTWTDAAPLLRILALAAVVTFPVFLTYPVMVALGRVRDSFVMGIITVPITVSFIWWASHVSAEAVAWSTLPSATFDTLVQLVFVARRTGIHMRRVLWATRKSALVTLATVVPVIIVVSALGAHDLAAWQALSALGVAGFAGWLGAMALASHPLWTEAQLFLSRLHLATAKR